MPAAGRASRWPRSALAQAAGRGAEWPHFIAAWNWSQVVQYLLLLAVSLPPLLGLPRPLASALAVATLGYQLWLVWFLARTTLRSPGLGRSRRSASTCWSASWWRALVALADSASAADDSPPLRLRPA